MAISLPCLERGTPEILTERHLQALWFDREMRPPILNASDGTEIRVVDPGIWNQGPGPDFHSCVLEIGASRRRMCGDVELHLRPEDWTAHAHSRNPDYSNIIAHVTWSEGERPKSLPKNALTISLARFFASAPGFSPEQIDLSGYPFTKLSIPERPCRKRLAGNPSLGKSVLMSCGRRRLASKAARLKDLLSLRGASRMQIFYEEFMGALGYARNSQAFRKIAKLVPYDIISSDSEIAANALETASSFAEWDTRTTRPANRPQRRLSSATEMLLSGSLQRFADIDDFSPKSLKRCTLDLCRMAHLGRGRAAAIITNIAVPFALAEKRIPSCPDWLPPEDLSNTMRLTALRLFSQDHNPRSMYLRNGLMMQGLLQIHRQYCLELYPDCDKCSVAED